jgi:hypothetical protein
MEEIMSKCSAFRKEQITVYGNATANCLDIIAKNIGIE